MHKHFHRYTHTIHTRTKSVMTLYKKHVTDVRNLCHGTWRR